MQPDPLLMRIRTWLASQKKYSPHILPSYVSPSSGIDMHIHKPWHTSKPIEDFSHRTLSLQARLTDPAALLIQLSVHLQGCHRTTKDMQPCIWHIHPTYTHLSVDEPTIAQLYIIDAMQHSTSNALDHQVPYTVQLLSLLHHCIVATGGRVLL